MKDYYIFSAALLEQMTTVTADNDDAAFEAGAAALGATGRIVCIEADQVYLADVHIVTNPQVTITRL